MSDGELLVTMRHVRQAAYCSRGTRAFFVRYRLDWDRFLREGLPAEQFLATGDAMAIRLVEVARGRR